MCDIITYKERIHDFAEKLDPFIFSNEGIEHAEIVLSEIYEHANDYVYVYCGSLSEQLTSRPKYFNALCSYLESGKYLKVLIEDKPEILSPALLKIIERSRNSDRIECKILNDITKINSHFSLNQENRVHFTVADKRIFRLETDPNNYRAFCSFNNVEISQKLSSIFLEYFATAETVSFN